MALLRNSNAAFGHYYIPVAYFCAANIIVSQVVAAYYTQTRAVAMNRDEIVFRINAFLEEDFEVDADSIKPEASLKETLALDSLDYIDLVVAIEHAFGFKVRPEDFGAMHTMADFYNYVEGRLEAVA